jgi:hypothetical protein
VNAREGRPQARGRGGAQIVINPHLHQTGQIPRGSSYTKQEQDFVGLILDSHNNLIINSLDIMGVLCSDIGIKVPVSCYSGVYLYA